MNSKERVLSALNLKKTDRVPFMELGIDQEVGEKIFNRSNFTKGEMAEFLKLDGIGIGCYPEIYVKRTSNTDRDYITGGLIEKESDLEMIDLTDPTNCSLYEEVSNFIDKYSNKYAIFVSTNIGLDPLLLGMGIENFSYALKDNLDLIKQILDIYTDWTAEVVLHLQEIGTDIIWFTDDIAFNTSLMFSPEFFREVVKPRLQKVMDNVNIPSIYHSDGNILPVINDLIDLGFNAIHPLDPSALDIEKVKEKYGSQLCLIGNIDLRQTLVKGTIEEVKHEVKQRIDNIGKNGGYILSSANTITRYCKLENIIAMRDALLEYG